MEGLGGKRHERMEMEVKCVACKHLKREVVVMEGLPLVVYNCPGHFPYHAALSGLLRPSKGIKEAADNCPGPDRSHCILCEATFGLLHYGIEVLICRRHDAAWRRWLNTHPSYRDYFSPRGRRKKDRWIEVFRKFIDEAQQHPSMCLEG
jgi:hypothetical protein